jgi:transcription elongation factor SPT6
MLTEHDELIRVRDIPERFQTGDEDIMVSDTEIAQEALFISRQLKRDNPEVQEKPLIVAVTSILRFLKIDLFEVPFIYAHRKDYFDGTLRQFDLWKIVDMDKKYTLAESKKKSLKSLIEKIATKNPNILTSPALPLVDKVVSLDDAADVSHFIQIQYSSEVDLIQQQEQTRRLKFKRPIWKVQYDDAKKNNIQEYAKLFAIDMYNYVQSVTTQQKMHFPEDAPMSPLESAVPFLTARFSTPQSVLEAAKILLGHQLASHPLFRSFIRRVYFTDAIVSVHLTDKGKSEIQSTHPYYPFKYLLNKPVYSFSDGQFLQIVDAESKGLLTITIRVEEEKMLLTDCMKHICNDDVNENAKKWNAERTVIALYAAKQVLFPHAAKWLKEKLAAQAADWIASSCRMSMEKVFSI